MTSTATHAVFDTDLDRLRRIVRGYGRVLVAFSGGVDSSFLLRIALDELGEDCHAVTCVSDTMARREAEDARRLAEEFGMSDRHHVVPSSELERENFAENPLNRCALCKTELMEHAVPIAKGADIEFIALGTNTDDLGDFRPGIAAARKYGAVSPLVEAGLDKQAVRDLSQSLGLRTWDKPQLACLSSRFPFGTRITPERLRRVDAFEDALRDLGFGQLRVRFHGDTARIELPEADIDSALNPPMRRSINAHGLRLGFAYVTVDLQGFRSGSLNPKTLVQLRK